MALLTDADRTSILQQLTLAPDSVLADAMLEFNRIRDKVVAVRKLVSDEPAAVSASASVTAAAEPVERCNVSPGKPSIGKIGTETKLTLLGDLAKGKQPAAKFSEHMRLLWVRGEVRFDGEEYWL